MDFGSEFGAVQTGRAFRNPGISLCHVAFRSAALLVYLFGGMFSSSFIGVFVAVVLLLSVDFWTVKNVTGRIMVIFNNILLENFQTPRNKTNNLPVSIYAKNQLTPY